MMIKQIIFKKYHTIFAIGVFIALFALLYKGFLFDLDNRLLFNSGDPVLNLYFLKWGADYILGNINVLVSSIYNLPVAFPFQNSLAFSDNLFGNQIVFLPYYTLTNNPLLAFNLWIMTTYFLNYIMMFYYLKKSKFINNDNNVFVSTMGASIFAFSTPCYNLLGGHLQLIPLYFMPISLLVLEKLIISLKTRYFVVFGLAVSFQFYLGIGTGFILLVLLMFLMPVYFVYFIKNKVVFLKKMWITVLFFNLPTVLLLLPYVHTAKLTGYRTYSEVLLYIPSILNFFSTNNGEKSIFVGLPVFLLFLLSVFISKTKKRKNFLFLIAFSYLFFLKEPHMFKLFFTYIPGFDSIRTPGRFIFVSITLIAIFVSVVLSKTSAIKCKVIFIAFMISLVSLLYITHIQSIPYRYFDKSIDSSILKTIKHQPTLVLPLYEFKNPDIYKIINRMKNINFEFPILDVYSGFNPTFVSEIESQYIHRTRTNEEVNVFLKRIEKLGFKYLLVEDKKMVPKELLLMLDDNTELKKLFEDKKMILYDLHGSNAKKISLNKKLETTSWQFNIEGSRSEKNHTVFYGKLRGKELSGVVQKKEQIRNRVRIHNKYYDCLLQLDKIKDSFSEFECTLSKH